MDFPISDHSHSIAHNVCVENKTDLRDRNK